VRSDSTSWFTAVAGYLELALVEHDGLRDRTPVPGPGREHEYPEKVRVRSAQVPAAERDENGEQIAAELDRLLLAPMSHTSDLGIVVVTHAYVVASRCCASATPTALRATCCASTTRRTWPPHGSPAPPPAAARARLPRIRMGRSCGFTDSEWAAFRRGMEGGSLSDRLE
jgi:hypothetical protein